VFPFSLHLLNVFHYINTLLPQPGPPTSPPSSTSDFPLFQNPHTPSYPVKPTIYPVILCVLKKSVFILPADVLSCVSPSLSRRALLISLLFPVFPLKRFLSTCPSPFRLFYFFFVPLFLFLLYHFIHPFSSSCFSLLVLLLLLLILQLLAIVYYVPPSPLPPTSLGNVSPSYDYSFSSFRILSTPLISLLLFLCHVVCPFSLSFYSYTFASSCTYSFSILHLILILHSVLLSPNVYMLNSLISVLYHQCIILFSPRPHALLRSLLPTNFRTSPPSPPSPSQTLPLKP
jgi:hypothetical protein